MKTLDKLIEDLENILPDPPTEYGLENEGYYIQKDVIQYLKEYQTLIYMLSLNTEVNIGVSSLNKYKIELTKPKFKNIIIE